MLMSTISNYFRDLTFNLLKKKKKKAPPQSGKHWSIQALSTCLSHSSQWQQEGADQHVTEDHRHC